MDSILDIFNDDAFSAVEMADALERVPYVPQLLGQLPIFTPKPISTTAFAIESRGNTLALVPTTPRGAPLPQAAYDPRSVRWFGTLRVAKGDRLNASELQNMRGFGTNTLQTVQDEVLRRQTKLRRDIDLTLERHRFGAVQGIVLDADGGVLFNWYDQWGITQPAEIDFELDDPDTDVRGKIRQVKRQMQVAAEGAWTPGTSVGSLTGDAFFDDLVNHANIKETRLQNERAPLLENIQGYSSIELEGVTFINYRGTDDGTAIAIGTNEAKFFPIGADGVFDWVQGPGETFDTVNRPGRPYLPMVIPDEKRNAFVELELYSYPAMVCTRPKMLQRAKRA
ncbi:MAG TPA: major capsid protein [Luteimonas sp.]|nr:major capsid protein [Luteimonas sp.]